MSTGKADTTLQLKILGVVAVLIVVAVLVLGMGSSLFGWSTPLLVAIVAAIVVVVGLVVWGTRRWWGLSQVDRALADTSALGDVVGDGAVAKGAELRGMDTGGAIKATDVAMLIGKVKKTAVYKTLEDFTLIIMGPRSNKTSSQAVPRILSAPGPVITTSNKPDLWILTAALRSKVGPVYGFDPGNIAFLDQTFWWNILADVKDFKSAKRLATHFMAGTGANDTSTGNSGFFQSASKQMLARNMLAAAISGRSMRDVITWIDTYSREPVALLRDAGMDRYADALDTQLDLVPETLSGVQGGASGALECLQDEDTLRWITPPDTWEQEPDGHIDELNLWELFTARDGQYPTLYLMSQEGAESTGPVLAALVDQIFKLSHLASSAQGGRIDPPLVMPLDEAANICRIEDLPAQASHLGSRGVLVDVILQSYQQGMGVWGRERMGALWGASTCRIIGAGLQDRDDARMVSDLIGTHEVWKDSYNYGPGGRSASRSRVREPIMPLEEVAALDRNHAIMIRQGSKPILMELMPWYREEDAADIASYAETATGQVRSNAARMLVNNPLGQYLAERNAESAV